MNDFHCFLKMRYRFNSSNACLLIVHAKSLRLCSTLCNPMEGSPRESLSVRFSKQEYWSGLPCPFPGVLPDPGIKPTSLISPALAGRFFTTSIT